MFEQLLDPLWLGAPPFHLHLIGSAEVILRLVQLKREPLPILHGPDVPKPTQADEVEVAAVGARELAPDPVEDEGAGEGDEAPWLGNAGAGEGRVEGLLVLLESADAVDDGGAGLEGDDAGGGGVGAVESEAEDGEAGGEVGAVTVEEDVLLEEGAAVEGDEEVGEGLMGGGVGKAELDLDLHRGGG